ncbi:MAG: hypothetical protein EXS32_17560 [Opitutus sp.]|nr:hypothetical protein [Opitutus sp.]
MKKLLCSLLVLLIPVIGLSQAAKKEAPKKATIETYRVMPKEGHGTALKAALAAHAQKFHSGNWKWRVSEVLSGPDAGAYGINEGPNSWTDLDSRGDLGPEHQKDYATNIAPHVEKSTPTAYYTYLPDVSTSAAEARSNTKTLIQKVTLKPGRGEFYSADLKIWKKIWEKRGSNVAVWRSFFSGEAGYMIAYRLKNGWKDLDETNASMRAIADEIGGAGTYDRLMANQALNIKNSVGEMIEFKPELSSK